MKQYIYCRQSLQEEQTLDEQEKMIRDYINDNNIQTADLICVKGKKENIVESESKSVFERFIEDVEKNKVSDVFIYDSECIGDDTNFCELLKQHDVTIHCADGKSGEIV